MIRRILTLIFVAAAAAAFAASSENASDRVTVGAERTDVYTPMLSGKRVALFSNHTGIVPDGRHTLDVMLDAGIDVRLLFAPEHGFRGTADAGAKVSDATDKRTGLPVRSLYGAGRAKALSKASLDSIDVIVCDIQDVGLRYYTYYITMAELMEASAAYGKEFVVLDRPNPNGMTVDGPVLDMAYRSGVGRFPMPTMHGLTLGEMARMAVGEGWIKGAGKLRLHVVPCLGYTHATRYRLPVAPSPNLKDMKAVYLYGSTCYFEGTPVSLGRGTDMPFTVYGHPDMKGPFSFTPRSVKGAMNPPQKGRVCHGRDLRTLDDEEIIARGVDFSYVIDAYRSLGIGEEFFTRMFDLLAGNGEIRRMIMDGDTPDEIRQSWADDVEAFRERRTPYLLYPE